MDLTRPGWSSYGRERGEWVFFTVILHLLVLPTSPCTIYTPDPPCARTYLMKMIRNGCFASFLKRIKYEGRGCVCLGIVHLCEAPSRKRGQGIRGILLVRMSKNERQIKSPFLTK